MGFSIPTARRLFTLSMATGSNASSSSLYDSFAQYYSDHINPLTGLHATDLIGLASDKIRTAKRILELGCGAGAFGLAYLQHFPHGIPGQTVVCTDLSPAMVHVAREVTTQKLSTMQCQTEFLFQEADATKLKDFDDNSFDMVISIFGIFLIPDRTATLQELRRVLADEGTLATTAWTSSEYNDELKKAGFGANLHDAMAMMKVLPKGTPPTDRKPQLLPQFVMDWFDRDTIDAMLQENHRFSHIEVRRSIHTSTFSSVEHMWNAFTKSNPHGAALLAQDPEQICLAREALGAYVAPDGKINRPVFLFSASNIVVAS
jgi:ubiquinone/menaquinone biosynthesis C-methylase UbiE